MKSKVWVAVNRGLT